LRKGHWIHAGPVFGPYGGQQWRRVIQNSRSNAFNCGRGRFRFNATICCRRARTSRAASLRLRKKTRMAMIRERMIAHISFDHPVQAADVYAGSAGDAFEV